MKIGYKVAASFWICGLLVCGHLSLQALAQYAPSRSPDGAPMSQQSEANQVGDNRAGQFGQPAGGQPFAQQPVGQSAEQLANLAQRFTKLGKKIDAVETSLKAVRYAPAWEIPPLTIALNLMDVGRWQDAIKFCRSSITLNSTSEDAYAALAAIYLRASMLPEAVAAGQDYLLRFPGGRLAEQVQAQITAAQHLQATVNDASASSKSSKKKAGKAEDNYLSLATAKRKTRWQASSMPLKVFIAPCSSSPDHSQEIDQCLRKAFQQWQAASQGLVSFVFVSNRAQADIECSWYDRSRSGMAWGPQTVVTDMPGKERPTREDSKVNIGPGCITFSAVELAAPAAKDPLAKTLEQIEGAALHGIGHSLGLLGHSNDKLDIMNESVILDSAESFSAHDLSKRDANTLLALYKESPEQFIVETGYSLDLDKPVGIGYGHTPSMDELLGHPPNFKISTSQEQQAQDITPDPRAARLFQQAQMRWQDDDASAALKLAGQAAQLQPNWYKPHLLMALSLKQVGNIDQALQEAALAMRFGGFDEEVWFCAAGILLKAHKYNDVVQMELSFPRQFSLSTEGQERMLQLGAAASSRIAMTLPQKFKPRDNYLDLATAQGSYHWPAENMPLKVFIPSCQSPLYNPEFKTRLLKAFEQWRSASAGKISFSMVDNANQANIECSWVDARVNKDEAARIDTLITPDTTSVHGLIKHGRIPIVIWSNRLHKKVSADALELQVLQKVGCVLGLMGNSADLDDIMYHHISTDITAPVLSERDKRTLQMLYSYDQKPGSQIVGISRSWLNSSIDEINNSFAEYSSMGGRAFTGEIPRDMSNVFASATGMGMMPFSTYPQGVPYPGWGNWLNGVDSALYQLRWELLTDPEQKARKLGNWYITTPEGGALWNIDRSVRHSVQIDRGDRHTSLETALSQHAYFQGKIRFLLEISKERHVLIRVLGSTLPNDVTERLKATMQALDGHPVLAFPANGPQYDRMSIICNFTFDEPAWMGKLPTNR